ncbi:MAG: hypothetical protein WC222_04865 [Parachlamydiales bacterium]|jgi:hypothetical protein
MLKLRIEKKFETLRNPPMTITKSNPLVTGGRETKKLELNDEQKLKLITEIETNREKWLLEAQSNNFKGVHKKIPITKEFSAEVDIYDRFIEAFKVDTKINYPERSIEWGIVKLVQTDPDLRFQSASEAKEYFKKAGADLD